MDLLNDIFGYLDNAKDIYEDFNHIFVGGSGPEGNYYITQPSKSLPPKENNYLLPLIIGVIGITAVLLLKK